MASERREADERRGPEDRRTDVMPGRVPEDVAALSAGLDALEASTRIAPSRWRRLWASSWPVLLAVLVVLVAWEGSVRLGLVRSAVLPSVSAVVSALTSQWRSGALSSALGGSLVRVTFGFMLSALVGIVLGVVVARVRAVRLPLLPLLTGLQALPAAALVPIAAIWFGGGSGDGVMYAVMLLGAAPSVAIGVIAGVDQIPPLFHRVGRILGANWFSSASNIVVPAALPGVVTGLKNGWMFTWRALMTAEIIDKGSELAGIGRQLNHARSEDNIALVLGVTIVILAVGVAAERLVFGPAERAVLRRRGLLERAV